MTTFTTQDRQDAERELVNRTPLSGLSHVKFNPLSEEDIKELAKQFEDWDESPSTGDLDIYVFDAVGFARAIERAHGIGE